MKTVHKAILFGLVLAAGAAAAPNIASAGVAIDEAGHWERF
jgi:hypothetical protein